MIKTKGGNWQYNTVAERLHEVHTSGKSFDLLERTPIGRVR
jgi:hypothetical protein